MSNPETKQLKNESKDAFFRELAELSERMIAAHGRDFSVGTLVLAARFIADNKKFTKSPPNLQQ